MTDLRDAFRALRATPIVTTVAILSLALGIGANTAIFSIVNALMLRSLPVKEPQHLVQLLCGESRTSWSNPLWEQVRARETQLFDGAFAYGSPQYNLAHSGEAEYVNAILASGGFFDVLGVPAILGRTFTRADDVRGGGPTPVAVISYGFWQRRFGGNADVIGKPLILNRVTLTIIGVTPPEFTGVDQGRIYDVAVPLGTEPLMRGVPESALDRRTWWWLRVVARLKPGQTLDQAKQALRGVQPQLRDATLPENYRPQDLQRYLKDPFNARPAANGPASLARQYRQPLFTIMAVVGMVLLIACANIANLLLARASARRHELSVRLALGASRWRIARQLIAESLLLSGTGAMFGLLFAQWGSQLLVHQLTRQGETETILQLSPDWRVLAFTAGVAILTALIFGTVPALRATHVEPNEAIKEHGRTIVGEGRFGFGSILVVLQVALSLVLVVGGALFMQSFTRLANVRLGFEPDPIVIADISAARSKVAPAERAQLYERIRQAVIAIPGVRNAAGSSITPVTGSAWNNTIENPPGMSLPETERESYINAVTPDWFATYGIPILAGRDISPRDAATTPHVILVNETFARKFFPGTNPIGKTVREISRPHSPSPSLEIVGLVKDAVYLDPRKAVPPTMYQALAQAESNGQGIDVAVRAERGSPLLLTRSLVDAIMRVDPDLSLIFRPLSRDIRANTVQERVIAMLSGFFGGLALILAGLGLYGVMSYAVSRRRTEIGIRMALGAQARAAIGLVVGRAAVLIVTGVVIGAALSWWASQFVSSLLYGLPPRDPATLAAAALILATVGALAGWLPARRAARIDPARVLREG